MSDEIVSGSQTETNDVEIERDAETESLYDTFGVRPQQAEKKDIAFPNMEQVEQQADEHEEGDELSDPPAIEETKTEPKKLTVKHNKQDVEVDISTDEKLTDHLQRSLALDKVREQAKQRETELDRAAKLLGYKDHAELTANLDKIEQERVQQQTDQFEALKQQVIEDLMYNGVNEEAAKEYAENNPLVQQARAALQEKQQAEQAQRQQTTEQQRLTDWKQLYDTLPDVAESAKAFSEGKNPDWYTPDMQSMIERGYKPLDAYKLAHGDKITAQTRKATEQKLIKQQQLGVRAQVDPNTATPPDEASLLPVQMSLAEEFGVSVKGVQRQNQLLKSRR